MNSDANREASPPPAASAPVPVVSIGLPVFNGARFLRQAVESLLAQTFRDFELVISDNASTDATADICSEFAAGDSRVRYIRQVRNIGAPRNWSFVASVARGRYFKWSSCNDLCAPDLLARCVATLEGRPDVVLCYGRTVLVDETSDKAVPYDGDVQIDDERASDRVISLLERLRLNNAQSGLIRRDVLMQTGLDRPYPGGDIPLMAELALRGKFILLPEPLLYRRMGPQTFSRDHSGRTHVDFYGAASAPGRELLRRYRDFAVGTLRAPVVANEKYRLLGHFLRRFYWDLRASSAAAPRARLMA